MSGTALWKGPCEEEWKTLPTAMQMSLEMEPRPTRASVDCSPADSSATIMRQPD